MKLVLAAILLSSPLVAHAADPAVAAKPIADPDKKICRAEDVTGSLFPKRVCHTRAEWAEIGASRQTAAERYISQKEMSGHALPLPN
ncbi:hypothetical protein [Sphingomonas sp. PAMC 26621]|uniref:hypothetical protein n=1 Tax=Sphingomonas sp. PAMC 26621 TaxID=1112213 RepID=UPI000289DD5E|nr:hypothetical protein [Sphingomonas sp. PAMC 26621]